ncbi:penicillin-binding transpeptidase domain-containing protein [Dorea amylophila]|uniref:peptidoglycan glycosyltransferase n=1 Tax=Dorea longicatena TaxID=88431 RepID=A0A174KJF3_9FIRM|nr:MULTISPECIES: penicillin-binding transpeptidase domain-containing protein [Dorea]MCU6740190.1 penicillin-binding transpeptidase domain-containing protein [Dorea amylophila]CUP12163.1 Penicillin-binding protein 4 precursor [Dorea longicatena]
MNKKRAVGIGIVGCVCVGIAIAGSRMENKENSVITDKEGKVIAELYYHDGKLQYQCDDKYDAYVDITCKDLLKIVEKKEHLSEKKAGKKIVADKMKIHTALEEKKLEAIQKGHESAETISGDNFAALVSDYTGKITACYSEGENGINYVDHATYAGSTIKPLSVYAPGIEHNQITWSSMCEDSPYTKVKDSDGNMTDWPQNTKPYTNQPVTVEQALKESNNAIAVKTLKLCGVEEACRFMDSDLQIATGKEQKIMQKEGEDSVLSNIALGYLKNGVTMRGLQSAYLMFGNGGKRYDLYTIEKVQVNGSVYYESWDKSGKQVIAEETAYVMNRLLKEVVSKDGTGKAAALKNVEVCGKTGTSRDYKDNWFVGMTPEYSCTVWYEEKKPEAYIENESPVIFHNILKNMKIDTQKEFPDCKNVVKMKYCKKTGLIANEHCAETADGYYNVKNVPDVCTCE